MKSGEAERGGGAGKNSEAEIGAGAVNSGEAEKEGRAK